MERATITATRVMLVLIMFGTVLAQAWFFPAVAGELAETFPELEWLRWPMLAVVVLIILGVQVALVAVWALLGMVERDRVFSSKAFRWVDVIIGAAVVDTVLVVGIFAAMTFWVNANPPGIALMQLAIAVSGAAVALLMAVMKGLLRKASNLTTELSEVI